MMMDDLQPDLLKKSKNMLILLGILCLILGVSAISAPLFAGTMLTVLIGAFMLITGVAQMVHSFHLCGHKVATFLMGLLSLVAGVLIFSKPLLGLAMLTMVLAVYFLMDGIMWIFMSFQMKPQKGWGMGLFNGIITLILGLLIWNQWPLSAVWAIGILLGIRILMAGMTMLFFGSLAGSLLNQKI